MIKVDNLCRNYGDFAAVKRVSFSLKPGEIVGLLGHNGAGKTTIMKMLTGFLEPSAGNIVVNGKPLEKDPLSAQSLMGYLPENSPLYPEMIVADYLDYCAELRGVPANGRLKAVQNAIRQTELQEKALQPIATLSRGYRQRVGVAQAILNQPKILILDEPTNGLDPSQIQHMRELIRELGKNSLVLLSTHILQEVNAICDRVLIIRHGELALDAKLNELHHTNRILLKTNRSAQDISAALKDLPVLSIVHSEPAHAAARQAKTGSDNGKDRDAPQAATPIWEHTIALSDAAPDVETATADLAQALVKHDIRIFSLHPESRDLETVFAEINQSTEVAHAA